MFAVEVVVEPHVQSITRGIMAPSEPGYVGLVVRYLGASVVIIMVAAVSVLSLRVGAEIVLWAVIFCVVSLFTKDMSKSLSVYTLESSATTFSMMPVLMLLYMGTFVIGSSFGMLIAWVFRRQEKQEHCPPDVEDKKDRFEFR